MWRGIKGRYIHPAWIKSQYGGRAVLANNAYTAELENGHQHCRVHHDQESRNDIDAANLCNLANERIEILTYAQRIPRETRKKH